MSGRPLPRRLTAWAMLVLQALVASGLPLPLAIPPAAGSAAGRTLAGKDRSRPFPCMDKACGCDSAERCFTNCCCHTPAETLAWARARGLEPAVLAALARRAVVTLPPPAAGGCCAVTAAQPAQPSCSGCEANDAAADTPASHEWSRTAAAPPPATDRQPAAGDEPAPQVVTLRAMLACGGIVAQWTAACVSLPPPETTTCEIPWPMIGTVAVRDEQPRGVAGVPDVPPPRGC